MNTITDETIAYAAALAKLALSEEESVQAEKDMERMLAYIDKLQELNTDSVEPMSHVFQIHNVFREDIVTNGDDREHMMQNAPSVKDGMFQAPCTVEQEDA